MSVKGNKRRAEAALNELLVNYQGYESIEPMNLLLSQHLEAILYNREESQYIYPEGDEVPQKSIQYVRTGDEPPVAESDPTQKDSGPVSDMGSAAERESDGTVSDFGQVSLGGQEPFEEDKTQSDFGRVIREPGVQPSPQKAAPKKGIRKLIIALVIACLVVAGCVAEVMLSGEKIDRDAYLQEVLDEAYSLYQSKQYRQCSDYAAEQLSFCDGNEALTAILASAQFELGDYEASAELYQELSAKADYEMKVENLRDYAVCLARLGRLDEAATVFVMLTDQGASADVTSYVLGETYYAKQDYGNAAVEFQKVLEITEDETLRRRCYNSLAETYRESGDYQASIDLLEEAVAQPQMAMDPVLYEMLGLAYYQYAQREGLSYRMAAQAFEQALQLGMQKEYVYTNAAYLYIMSDEDAKAQSVLDSMEQVYPNSYLPHALRAVSYIYAENEKDQSQRDYFAAQEEYETAKSMATSSEDQTYLQMVESLIAELEHKGWL